VLEWQSFRDDFAKRWEPGDHVSVLARTKAGKSTFVGLGLLPMWNYTLTLDVKNDGSVPIRGGRSVKDYPAWYTLAGEGPHHYRVAPGWGPHAVRAFDNVFRQVWSAGREDPKLGSWTLYIDELKIMSDKLKMRDHLEVMYVAGRSRGITMIGSTQAPRDVPSEFYDQPTWLVIGAGTRDLRTLDRLGEITGDRQRLRDVAPQLDFGTRQFYIAGPDFEAITSLPASMVGRR
jgi:hypothetical protein